MELKNHGASCCGIKQMHGFGDPDGQLPAYDYNNWLKPKAEAGANYHKQWPQVPLYMCNIMAGTNNPPNYFMPSPMPAETALQRFHRLIAYWKEKRTHGVIEAVLNYRYNEGSKTHGIEGVTPSSQTGMWHQHLIDAGFVCVTDCYNSNSTNRIRIYHLARDNRGKKEEVRPEPAPKPASTKLVTKKRRISIWNSSVSQEIRVDRTGAVAPATSSKTSKSIRTLRRRSSSSTATAGRRS